MAARISSSLVSSAGVRPLRSRTYVDALLAAGASTYVLDRKGRTPAEDTADEGIRAAILAARAF